MNERWHLVTELSNNLLNDLKVLNLYNFSVKFPNMTLSEFQTYLKEKEQKQHVNLQ